jgi:hypothetical protein
VLASVVTIMLVTTLTLLAGVTGCSETKAKVAPPAADRGGGPGGPT